MGSCSSKNKKPPPQPQMNYQQQPPANPQYQQPPRVQHAVPAITILTDDVTYPWGQQPDPIDRQNAKWRSAVFQDMQESVDQNLLYFLYDPVNDEQCVTTGARKSMTSLVVFDVNRCCFVAEIPLRVLGRVKMLFALPQPSSDGGTAFVITSQSEDYGQFVLHVWRFDLQADGVTPLFDPFTLLKSPIPTGTTFICSMRMDRPELVTIYGPGMNIACIDVNATEPQPPFYQFSVPGAQVSHFYDGFLSQGNVYFLSSSPDNRLEYSRVHVLNLQSQQLSTQFCTPDPTRGFPPMRKEAALDSTGRYIFMAGGEVNHGGGNVQRLIDYWVLDLSTFQWYQVPSKMAVALIEPRLTKSHSGNVFLWGDFDDPLPYMKPKTTHVRILRLRGLM